MSGTRNDQTGKRTRDDLPKRPTLTKLGVDGGPRQAGKTSKPVDKGTAGELTSTPVNSWQQPRSRRAEKAGCHSPVHLESSRRRTEASVVNEETLRMMGTRRSAAEFRTPECFTAVAFETPGAQLMLKRTTTEMGVADDDNIESYSSSVTVAVRVRPFMPRLGFCSYHEIYIFKLLIMYHYINRPVLLLFSMVMFLV